MANRSRVLAPGRRRSAPLAQSAQTGRRECLELSSGRPATRSAFQPEPTFPSQSERLPDVFPRPCERIVITSPFHSDIWLPSIPDFRLRTTGATCPNGPASSTSQVQAGSSSTIGFVRSFGDSALSSRGHAQGVRLPETDSVKRILRRRCALSIRSRRFAPIRTAVVDARSLAVK